MIPWAAKKLNRPVKWIEDRLEHFFATTHERGQTHDAEIALSADGRILGIKDVFLHDTGAYNPYGLTVPINSQCTLLGPYVVPNYDSAPSPRSSPTSRSSRPIAAPAASTACSSSSGCSTSPRTNSKIDRAEIRRRNLIPPDAFPYNNEIIYQDFAPLSYDSGNYEPILDKALEMIGYEKFLAEEQPRLRAQGRHVGVGVACYVEGTGIGPYEGAKVQVQANGKVSVATGIGTQGQGHFTSFAQIAADQLGVEVTDVDIVTGDTDQFYWGAGTFASRGAVVAGNAVNEAAKVVRQKILKLAAEHFECAEEDLEIAERRSLGGRRSRPGDQARGAGAQGQSDARRGQARHRARTGSRPNISARLSGATASGVHAMIVEVDPQTFTLQVLKYVVVHDCGTVINPLILAGQIHGGVAQGIGNAFYEQLVFDEEGQLLNASLADYLLPTALEVPHMDIAHTVTRVAAQSARHQGRGRGRRHSGRAVVRAGDRGCARAAAAKHRAQRNSAEPEPAVRADHETGRAAMILVTGAAGKTGTAVVKALAAKGAPVRALGAQP